MIHFDVIAKIQFESLIKKFDEDIDYLKNRSALNIELKTYGNILRSALNNIQPESFDNLIKSLGVNRELENALNNAGGYTMDYLSEHNPKNSLSSILRYLKADPIKLNALIDVVNLDKERKVIVADANDVDYLNQIFRLKRLSVISFTQFKKDIRNYRNLIFYSFNGKRDFDFLSSFTQDLRLVIHAIERDLYEDQVIKRKRQIEEEVGSKQRELICGITYRPTPIPPIQVSTTIGGIIDRIDKLGDRDYENYKEEGDSLLDQIEKSIYWIKLNNGNIYELDSNETIFDEHGDLIKVYRSSVSVGAKMRIYPREKFAEYLYQVAVETDNDIFKKVEEHSKLWISILLELKLVHRNNLYGRLKEKGLKVLPTTVEAYSNSQRKFPMYNNDLKAMFLLKYRDMSQGEIDSILGPIRKSKSIYNSTMIALGRGLKQEIKLFLKEKRIGEILTTLRFDATSLQVFIDHYMPLLVIKEKGVHHTEGESSDLFNVLFQTEL